jgi:hypothetical protein
VRRLAICSCAAAVVMSASCGGQKHSAALSTTPCEPPVAPHADWQPMDRDAFSFMLPPHFRRLPATGIDSWVEMYVSFDKQDEVSFDYGQWSNDLRPDSDAYEQYSVCADTIGGRFATIVTLKIKKAPSHKEKRPYVAAATWRSLNLSRRIATHLTIWTQTDDARRLGTLLAVLHSVRFATHGNVPAPRIDSTPVARTIDTVVKFRTETSLDSTLLQGEIAGRLLNAVTGAPLQYGEVSIVYPDHRHTSRRAFADAEGNFRIRGLPDESARVIGSRLGFRSDSISLNPSLKRFVRFALAVDPTLTIRY